jgi:DNA-binding NarL/FixJ family response regulator
LVKVLLADDDAMSVLGIRQVLLAEPDFEVVGEVRGPRDVLPAARSLRPDVLLLARSFGGRDAVALTREVLSALTLAVLVISTGWEAYADPLEPLWAGASGLLLKADLASRLAPAARDVAAGGVALDPTLGRAVVDRLRDGAAPPDPGVLGRLAQLTGREQEVLRRLGGPGSSNRDIALAMGISPLTVKAHVRRILAKLEVADRREAGRTARYLDDELHLRRRATNGVRPGRTTSAPGA